MYHNCIVWKLCAQIPEDVSKGESACSSKNNIYYVVRTNAYKCKC